MWYILPVLAAEPWGDVKVGEQFDPTGWHCDKETCFREGQFGGVPVRVSAQICQGRAQEVEASWSVGTEHGTEVVADPVEQARRADAVLAGMVSALEGAGYEAVDEGEMFGAQFKRWKHGDDMRTIQRKDVDHRIELAVVPGVPVPCGTPGQTQIDVLPEEVSPAAADASLDRWSWTEAAAVERALRKQDPPPGWHIEATLQDAADTWPKSATVSPIAVSAGVLWETWGKGIVQTGVSSVRAKDGKWRVLFKAPVNGVPADGDEFADLKPWIDYTKRLPAASCGKIEPPDRETMTALDPRMRELWSGVIVDMTEAQRRSCEAFTDQHPSSTSVSIARETFRVHVRKKTLGVVEVLREADGSRTLTWRAFGDDAVAVMDWK